MNDKSTKAVIDNEHFDDPLELTDSEELHKLKRQLSRWQELTLLLPVEFDRRKGPPWAQLEDYINDLTHAQHHRIDRVSRKVYDSLEQSCKDAKRVHPVGVSSQLWEDFGEALFNGDVKDRVFIGIDWSDDYVARLQRVEKAAQTVLDQWERLEVAPAEAVKMNPYMNVLSRAMQVTSRPTDEVEVSDPFQKSEKELGEYEQSEYTERKARVIADLQEQEAQVLSPQKPLDKFVQKAMNVKRAFHNTGSIGRMHGRTAIIELVEAAKEYEAEQKKQESNPYGWKDPPLTSAAVFRGHTCAKCVNWDSDDANCAIHETQVHAGRGACDYYNPEAKVLRAWLEAREREDGKKWVVAKHASMCAVGKHEAGIEIGDFPVPMAVCKHCRCYFNPRPEKS